MVSTDQPMMVTIIGINQQVIVKQNFQELNGFRRKAVISHEEKSIYNLQLNFGLRMTRPSRRLAKTLIKKDFEGNMAGNTEEPHRLLLR